VYFVKHSPCPEMLEMEVVIYLFVVYLMMQSKALDCITSDGKVTVHNES
jgi:hypothetical protein